MSNQNEQVDPNATVVIEGVGGREPWAPSTVFLAIGIPLIAIFTALASWWGIDHIEDQLEAEARADLAANGIPVGDADEIDFDYRDGDAWIALPAGVTAGQAEDAVDHRLLNDFDVHQRGTSADHAELDDDGSVTLNSTEVDARLENGVITLTGTVPLESHRAQLVEAAAAVVGAANVVDELVVADGPATDGAGARIADLATAIGTAGAGDDLRFSMTDTSLDVQGSISEARAAALQTAVDGAGLDGTADLDVIAFGSTEVTVRAAGSESVTVVGSVLTETQRTRVIDAAAAAFGAQNVVDQLVVLGADPLVDGADQRVAELVAAIGQIGEGTAVAAFLTDEGVELEQAPDDLADDEQINELQVELDALADEIRENVVFATGSDVLDAGATATLDKVVAAMTEHPLPVVGIAGHTDSTGDPEANRTLSGARAQAVVAYLIGQGIDADRLQSRGAGADEPIADNSTDEGRAQNRRVELTAAAEFVG